MDAFAGFSKRGLKTLSRLDSPGKVDRFLLNLPYNLEENGPTASSPQVALGRGSAHCLEGALLAACALRFGGRAPLVMDLRSVRDEDHVLCVYREGRLWGSIAKSKFWGLRGRQPVYRTLRELAMSYFDGYLNYAGERTLREYSAPLDLSRFDEQEWMVSCKPLWFVSDCLDQARHYPLLPRKAEKLLGRANRSEVDAAIAVRRSH